MRHVLIADEDVLRASVYVRMLVSRGFTAEVVGSAQEALRAIAHRPPDAILADLGLPQGECIPFLRTVRDLPQGRAIRIFVLANAFLESEALEAWDAGADQVVGASNYPPEQIVEFLIAEVGGGASSAPATMPSEEVALGEFLIRARGYAERARMEIDRVRAGGAAPPALDVYAASMRRLQAAQAFRLPVIPQIAAVGEWLARALVAWPSSTGPSSLRTLDQVITALGTRLEHPRAPVRELSECLALAVDDDPMSRTLVQQAFRKIRLPCDVFESGSQALDAATVTQYDFVVSDVMMPGMDGFELVRRLRERQGYERTPIVYVTALDGFDAAFARDAHGGTDAITKPYLIMELAAKAVAHLLGRR